MDTEKKQLQSAQKGEIKKDVACIIEFQKRTDQEKMKIYIRQYMLGILYKKDR